MLNLRLFGPVLLAFAIATLAAAAETGSIVPNGSFEQGEGDRPTGWTLEGAGEWVSGGAHSGRRCVAVEGEGRGVAFWACHDLPWKPNQLYQMSFWSRADAGTSGGCVVSGPVFANDDWGRSTEWTRARYVFLSPSTIPADAYLRVGVWETRGRVYFDDVELLPTLAIHKRFGDLELGEGERVEGTSYVFSHPFSGYANNYARPLAEFTAGYNSSRWVFGPGASVVYKHTVPGARLTEVKVTLAVNYHTEGTCVVEASSDGQKWEQIGTLDKVAAGEFPVPVALLPAEALMVRLRSPGQQEDERADSAPGSFQVNAYTFSATLDRDLGSRQGATTYVTIEQESPDLTVAVKDLGTGIGESVAQMTMTNRAATAVRLRAELVLTPEREGKPISFGADASVAAGATREVKIPWQATKVGTYDLGLRVTVGGKPVFAADAGQVTVPHIQDASYGYLISADGTADLWWCEGAWKIGRERAVPTKRNPELYVELARAEFEPVQLVVRPRRNLTGLRVSVSDLRGERGTLPASAVSIKQVEYVYVKHPTDKFGAESWWPDPLPAVKGPLDAPAGRNLPLWLTVHAPREARPGIYRGTVSLAAADGWRAQVPLRVRVFSFAIPEEVHVQTGLGLGQGEIWRYHNLTAAEDAQVREQVWDLYMQDWRDHHIAPYRFWTKGFEVKTSGFAWSGGEYDTEDPHTGKQCLKIVDDSPVGNPSAVMDGKIPLERGKPYVLRLWAKTASEGQEFMVTLGQINAAGQWLSGNNIDVVLSGTTQWKQYEVLIDPARFNAEAVSLSFTLRPTRWMEPGQTMGTTWFDDLYLGVEPDGPNLLADPGFEATPDDVKVTIDWTEWDRQAAKYLDDYHFTSFVLPVMGLGGGRYPNYDPGRFGPFKFGTPDYERLMGDYLMELQNHLEEKGWLKKAYIYWYDEPGEEDYDFVVERMKLIKRLAPKLTRMLTEQPEPPLYGAVDLWCPVLSNYSPEVLHARQKEGDRVWWYVCCGPRAPWLGLFIDHPHTDMRAWLWATWKWNVEGCLIWTTTWWTCGGLFGEKYQNPWEDPMSYTADSKPGAVGYWGNGDGRFLYPPNRRAWQDQETKYIEGPVDCYRWEQLRDGIDDYEYLWMLREAISKQPNSAAAKKARALLEVPAAVMGEDATQFSHQPLPMLEHRHRVAEALEALSK